MGEIEELRRSVIRILSAIENTETEERIEAMLKSINDNILKLRYQHKASYSLKEVSENTGINIKTIYRLVDLGKLKAKKEEGIPTIVLQEDLINFLKEMKYIN